MRHIPTTSTRVEQLKKQAKRLKATKGGKHVDHLNAVAKSAGYDHWHHVVQCQERTERPVSTRTLGQEVDRILDAEAKGEIVIVMTGPEITSEGPLILFSTGIGDAWLIDPDDNSAACLRWHAESRPRPFREFDDGIEIDWDGHMELNGQFVNFSCPAVPEIGTRAVGGYPVEGIRKLMLRAQSVGRKMLDIFGRLDGVELTDQVIDDLVRQGWDSEALNQGRAGGARYSPGRNSLIYPAMSNLDE
ncbi:MAG: hypothetical protein KGZ70_01220 [Hydrogenophaga sp.]|nr:hypothetical protein [Hydrogenophaga sp.]